MPCPHRKTGGDKEKHKGTEKTLAGYFLTPPPSLVDSGPIACFTPPKVLVLAGPNAAAV